MERVYIYIVENYLLLKYSEKKKMLTHIIMSIHDVHKFYNGPENISSSV